MRDRRAMVGATVAFATLFVIAVAIAVGLQPSHHPDGEGVLASLGGPGSESVAVDAAASGGTRFSYGLRLCTAEGVDPAVIRGVTSKSTVGTGFTYLGARIRTFRPTESHIPINSAAGFPPPDAMVSPDRLNDANGHAVATSCDAAFSDEYTELLIGLELTSPDGGGWQGILIDYDVEGRRGVLEVDRGLLLCGTSYPVCN